MAAGNKRSNSNMLRYPPHHLFLVLVLVLVLIFRPANASYKLVLESGSADDVIKFMCSDFQRHRHNYVLKVEEGEPATAYFQSGQKVLCSYEYKYNELADIVLFDGYKPDEDCRAELGGCTFIIKDAVVYKKTQRWGTQVRGDLPDKICKTYKLWWFSFDYDCGNKPHLHPYVRTLA